MQESIQSTIERVEAAINVIAEGGMIIVMDDKSRENEGDVIFAAELANSEMTNFMVKEARGLVCVPMSKLRAEKLGLHLMVNNNEDPYKTAFTVSVDHHSLHTGISAIERSVTIRELSNDDAVAQDFNRPGHIFPLIAKDGGVLERRGHTEAAVDMMRLAGLKPVAAICEILKDDGSMAREEDLREFANKHQLLLITIQDIVDYRDHVLLPQSAARLPTKYGEFRIYSFPNRYGDEPHLALVKKGSTFNGVTTIRMHSECLTGDVFHSIKCDCQPQLDFGMQQVAAAGSGVLIYLRQEGRGIGLVEKLKAYALQDMGVDTIDANTKLGHKADERTYQEAINILNYFKIKSVNVVTNNPEKVRALREASIDIKKRIPTPRFETEENSEYLRVKEESMGHHFNHLS